MEPVLLVCHRLQQGRCLQIAAEHEDDAALHTCSNTRHLFCRLAMGEGRDKVLEGSGGAGLGGEGDEEARKRRWAAPGAGLVLILTAWRACAAHLEGAT